MHRNITRHPEHPLLFQEDEFIIIQHNFTQLPDKFQVIPSIGPDDMNSTETMVNNEDNYHGDWHFDPEERLLSFLSKYMK